MDKEVVPNLTLAELDTLLNTALAQTDGNRPQTKQPSNGFLEILEHGKSEISSSPAFIRKVVF